MYLITIFVRNKCVSSTSNVISNFHIENSNRTSSKIHEKLCTRIYMARLHHFYFTIPFCPFRLGRAKFRTEVCSCSRFEGRPAPFTPPGASPAPPASRRPLARHAVVGRPGVSSGWRARQLGGRASLAAGERAQRAPGATAEARRRPTPATIEPAGDVGVVRCVSVCRPALIRCRVCGVSPAGPSRARAHRRLAATPADDDHDDASRHQCTASEQVATSGCDTRDCCQQERTAVVRTAGRRLGRCSRLPRLLRLDGRRWRLASGWPTGASSSRRQVGLPAADQHGRIRRLLRRQRATVPADLPRSDQLHPRPPADTSEPLAIQPQQRQWRGR